MSNLEQGLFYTKEHEWARINGSLAQVGITDHAQEALGDITFVELPKVGDEVKQFARLATVESVKAASDVYSPLSGKVLKVNPALSSNPGLVNKSAYTDGWFVEIQISQPEESSALMSAADYQKHLEGLAK